MAGDVGTGWRAMPECRWTWLQCSKNSTQDARACSTEPKRSGDAGQYFKVLNAASEYGLSLDTWGRLWLRDAPRSTINWDTGLERMDEPLSAWMVRWSRSNPWVRTASWTKSVANLADSMGASSHPTT